MKPKLKHLESPFGWEAGLEYEKLQKKKVASLSYKMRTLFAIAACILFAVVLHWLLSSPSKQDHVEPKTQGVFDIPLVNPSVLKPKGSYEAAKQLYTYVEVFSEDVAKELNSGVLLSSLSRRNGINADIDLLAANTEGAAEYFYMRIASPIGHMVSAYSTLRPINGLFGLGVKKAGDAKNEYFSYGMSVESFIDTCIKLPDGFDDSLRKSCRIAVFYNEFLEKKFPYANVLPYITGIEK